MDPPDSSNADPYRQRPGRLTIGRRLGLLVALVAAAVAIVAVVAIVGVQRIDRHTEDFYEGTLEHATLAADLQSALQRTEVAALEYALIADPGRRAELKADLGRTLVPEVNGVLADTEAALRGEAEHERLPALDRVRDGWERYLVRFGPGSLGIEATSDSPAAAAAIQRSLERVTRYARIVADAESEEAALSREEAGIVADSTLTALIAVALISGALATGLAFMLSRSIVRRTREYSRFAAGVAAGRYGERLEPQGADELTELGGLLNRMVEHRDAEQAQGRQRSEFTEAMQLTGSETEAHDLLKRHLERSIPASTVTVLNRNNSANRLEPTTALDPDDPIRDGLREAQPQDCLAVRSGQPHRRDGEEALLTCTICGAASTSACRPLLVGGEVIGAVLARRDQGLSEAETETMRGSVVQAAPLLANLRNLALAERRAGTDALTGLPNQRASHETLARMVAQAARSQQPLSVLLMDLDHFKQVNDVFGHSAGDNVLAAVGVNLRSAIREADFCGRWGGEEFIVLLPDTALTDGGIAAEKVRASIATIQVSSVQREITASIGVAAAPDHGSEGETVVRIADRALYAAKSAGRNRVEVAPEGASLVPVKPAIETGAAAI